MTDPEPCIRCGACCADRQVVFDGSECDEVPYVPEQLSEPVTGRLRAMGGTDRQPPRCLALAGRIGEGVRCTIYERRPSPCRDYAPDGLFGIENGECTAARARHGLPPLPCSRFATEL